MSICLLSQNAFAKLSPQEAGESVDAAAEATFCFEREWVVGFLFEPAPSPAHLKSKSVDHKGVRGCDQFFDTIKNCMEDRVQRAWHTSCGSDVDNLKVVSALANPKTQVPPSFKIKWEVALRKVFGEDYKFVNRTHLSTHFIKGEHVFKLRSKAGAPTPRTPRAPPLISVGVLLPRVPHVPHVPHL